MDATRTTLIILGGLLALGGGGLALNELGRQDPAGEAVAPTTEAPTAGTAPAAGDTQDMAAATRAPAIDVVRLERDGSALVGGTAAPGASVEILVDDTPVWTGTSDAVGAFVAFVTLPASESGRMLWLRSTDAGGQTLRSDGSVVLAPLPPLQSAASNAPVSAPSPETGLEPPEAARASGPETDDGRAEAPAIAALQSDSAGVRPLQPPPLAPDAGLALDTVRYGSAGEVVLSGRSESPDQDLSIYLDGQIAARARTGRAGDWQAVLADVPSGTYRLRADLEDTTGRVAARVDLPFRREAPEIVEAARVAASEADQSAALITVQPGYSLWIIARDRYGDGFQYVAVYDANADQIADPDLIYPGQVLTLPARPATVSQ